MKIGFLLLNTHSGQGGLEKVLSDVVLGLESQGVSSYIYALYKPTNQNFIKKFKFFEYVSVPNAISLRRKIVPKFLHKFIYKVVVQKNSKDLWQSMLGQKLDALVVLNLSRQFSNNYKKLYTYKRLSNTPIISWTHSSLADTKFRIQLKIQKQIGLFDSHFALGEGIKREIESMYGQRNIQVVYNPIKESQEFALVNPKRFLYIGRIDANKRVMELLQTLKKIQGEWHLDIFGSTGDTDSDLDFEKWLRGDEVLSEKVLFHGWKENVWDAILALNSTGVLLLNSRSEGSPLVLVEAMMRGVPCVASDCPVGPSDIIVPGINGWLYPMNDENICLSILQKIVDGKLELPASEDIRLSVERFEFSNATLLFLDALKAVVNEFK